MYRKHPPHLDPAPIIALEPLTEAQLDYLQWAMIRWTIAFRAGAELTPTDLLCPPDTNAALIDTINAHRYYLTARKECRCIACEHTRLAAALRTLLQITSPIIVIVEPSTLHDIGGEG